MLLRRVCARVRSCRRTFVHAELDCLCACGGHVGATPCVCALVVYVRVACV